MSPIGVAVSLVAAERMAELVFAERNTRALKRAGAVEVGRGHYPLLVILHAAWLVSLVWWVPASTQPNLALIVIYVALQFVRLWAILSLGRFWTTRIITLDAPLAGRGPYRLMRHPIYAVVVSEIALLPLAFGAWKIALVFSTINAALLTWRIRMEDGALAGRRRA
jgi:methyltransferase